MQWRFLQRLLAWAVRLTVPRQRIGVSLVALDGERRVFMLKHVLRPLAPWGLPGGWLKRNEDPDVGVLRELREETGLTAVLGPVIHVQHEERPDYLGIAYLAHIQPGRPRLSPEIVEARWFPVARLPHPISPFVHQAIEAALSHQKRGVAWTVPVGRTGGNGANPRAMEDRP